MDRIDSANGSHRSIAGARTCRPGEWRPVNETGHVSLLRDGFLLLGFALVFVLVFRRLGLGATLGYLVAGALVGPQVLGLVDDAQGKLGIAELGITLLLFVVGLELNPARLWRLQARDFRPRAVAGDVVRAGGGRAWSPLSPVSRRPPRSRSGCRWRFRRPRRCCRCCARRDGCARRSASAPSPSCCSRTCRSSR